MSSPARPRPPAALLRQQANALGRRLRPNGIFRRVIRREVGGRPYSEIVRRLSPPNRYRDDLSVEGRWRFSESFDGERAWYRDQRRPDPAPATGPALDAYRWTAVRLDYLQPLEALTRLGCTLEDGGMQPTVDGQSLRAVRISLLATFAETVFLDGDGRLVAHHLDLPEAGEDEQKLEAVVSAWGEHDGLVHPVRSTVKDRQTGEIVAEIQVADARTDPYAPRIFALAAD